MFELRLPLILASGSPRRKEILSTMGIPFTVLVSDADETFSGAPEQMVLELSKRKAEAAASKCRDSYVLAADTIVFQGEILGKPESAAHAIQMLQKLSGQWHSVFTGMTLLDTQTGRSIQRVCETRVHFAEMTEQEIRSYAQSGEPLDKAGAYGIQGLGGAFVDRIEGSYSNVVGLPMSVLREMIIEINVSTQLGDN